jgi:hypothetical protein
MNDFIKSSTGSGKLATTIQGILILLVPFFIYLGDLAGLSLTDVFLVEKINEFTLFIGAILTTYGLGRKLVYSFKDFQSRR